MNARTYLRATLGLVLLLAGGAGVGVWVFSGEARPDPGVVPPIPVADPAAVRVVVVGGVGLDAAPGRHVRDGVALLCAERGCDAIVLLGDLLPPGGMEAADDPRADERLGPWAALGVPVLLVAGEADDGPGRDLRRAAWLAGWAAGRDGVEAPAPTWTATLGPVGLWALDTGEVRAGDGDAQRAWLDGTVRASSARWRVALGSGNFRSNGASGNADGSGGSSGGSPALAALYDEAVCGRFDLVITSADASLQWIERCGLANLVVGAGATAAPIVDRGNRTVFERAEPGFAWLAFGADAVTLAFYDDVASLRFEARRARDGALSDVRAGG
jgi:hypothetical protein